MIRNLSALNLYLAKRAQMPFGWWTNDCITHANGAVIAQGGPDCLAGVTPWTDEASALAVMASLGGIEAAIGAKLKAVAPAHAMRGDIGLVPLPQGKFVVVVVEVTTLVGPGVRCAARYPRKLMTKAWGAL